MMKKAFISACAVAVFVWAWNQVPSFEVSDFKIQSDHPASVIASDSIVRRFASSDVTNFVHSASLAPLPNGAMMAVWFAGSREGASDVQIRAARFNPETAQWSQEHVLATRVATEAAIHKNVRKLGNPVIALAPDNRLWLFYVSVSVGGWAGSAINVMHSEDMGATWSAPRQLVTTPFFNLSTLVRGAPVFHENGTIGLPIYHEFMGKFAEYLYLDPNGQVLDKFRISKGKHSLQPTIVAQNGRQALALLRYAGEQYHRVLASRTLDAGKTWSKPQPLEPSNPNSSLAAVGRGNGNLLVAMNDLEDGRFRLSLYETGSDLIDWRLISHIDESPDPWGDPVGLPVFEAKLAETWAAVKQPGLSQDAFFTRVSQRMCEAEQCRFEYEYPYFTRDATGNYHLAYSWNDTLIKHVSFNDAWVEKQK